MDRLGKRQQILLRMMLAHGSQIHHNLGKGLILYGLVTTSHVQNPWINLLVSDQEQRLSFASFQFCIQAVEMIAKQFNGLLHMLYHCIP